MTLPLGARAQAMRAACIPTALALLAGLALPSATALAADPFMVTSPAYKDGDVWPAKFAGADPSRTNPPCPGQNVSPPLAWSNAPEKTKTFAIVMYDPDGGNGTGAVHWVAYGIPKTKTSLAEGEASASPKDWVGGKNNIGSDHYFGPCGPAGHALHHYIITVIATDLDPGTLKPGLTRDELLAAVRGSHALAPASIVGRYTRPTP
jgi:Raf kinase inhibitor-like YbhB/YbcL family protein